jgi:Ca-activated chloride channel family protein
MSISMWLRTPRIRRGLAASAVVLAAGGLILFKANGHRSFGVAPAVAMPNGKNTSAFSGPGVHGSVGLSHGKVLWGSSHVYAEVKLAADASDDRAKERAPLSIAVVLDTSGSMSGEKIEQARQSVLRLIGDMRDDDEIAIIRFSDSNEVIQPLTRVGRNRFDLEARVRGLQADGGTYIPGGLSQGLRALDEAGRGRVKRVILVSDGLDQTRAQAERLASDGAERGVTISSIGIGLDFDESYMGGIARLGHGNFAFVNDSSSLAKFLQRELRETASTTVENATVRINLPRGVRFVDATGAQARTVGDGSVVELKMGSLFAGDERRAVVELATDLDVGDVRRVDAEVEWDRVGGAHADLRVSPVEIVATSDPRAVDDARDGAVFASATSVLASKRQLEANEAWSRGDTARADQLAQQNMALLGAARAAAPAPAAGALARQSAAYEAQRKAFRAVPPGSDEAKAFSKKAAEQDSNNITRPGF